MAIHFDFMLSDLDAENMMAFISTEKGRIDAAIIDAIADNNKPVVEALREASIYVDEIISKMYNRRVKIEGPLKIVEGVESVWYYHLSETGANYGKALCGRREVMHTEIPLSTWGKKGGNVPSSYCPACDGLYKEIK
jgi:hypothetical protein